MPTAACAARHAHTPSLSALTSLALGVLLLAAVRGVPGAHVVLRQSLVAGRPPPDDECLQMAADLAAFYSEARDENKILVTYTSPKHVNKPKGAVRPRHRARACPPFPLRPC